MSKIKKTPKIPFKKRFLESEKRFQDLLDHLPVGVYRTTPDGKIIEANQALADMLGYERHEDLKDINVKDFYVRAEDRAEHLKELDLQGTFCTEFELRRKDGQTIWGRDYPRAVVGSGGKINYYDGILLDITKQKNAEEELKGALYKLETLSLADDLTGLYNRRGFFTIAVEHFKMADRQREKMFLLFMDLDNLKNINDTFGHHMGDQALVCVSDILKGNFRSVDVKGRMGGDEFAVFLVGASREGMEAAESRLRKKIEMFNENKEKPFQLSVSMGASYYDPLHPCTIDELLVRADKIMYEEKRRKGRS
ncbi:MAG: GGDEF domain-containing protein [Candidatus Aminicenantes bacterium]|nr:MAG: GGDEF domain-containing protein [Candidatus Aminicenantes bacterium]